MLWLASFLFATAALWYWHVLEREGEPLLHGWALIVLADLCLGMATLTGLLALWRALAL